MMISNITNRTDPSSVKSRVFVGNLNTVQMTKDELEDVFKAYGSIIGISVHKGYAFVQYAKEDNARAAVLGEDSKQYYNMILDVTIASEPKNRKRGRSNAHPGISSGPGLTELALQAHALSSSSSLGNPANTKYPMLSVRQPAGRAVGGGAGGGGGIFEGIMGQPNLSQFAAAAGVLGGAAGSSAYQISPSAGSSSYHQYPRPKSSRPIGQLAGGIHGPLSATSSSSLSLSGAKRTRLEAGTPMGYGGVDGARAQNLGQLASYDRSRYKVGVRSAASQRHHHQSDYDEYHYHAVPNRTKSPRQTSRGPFRPQLKSGGREGSPLPRATDASGDSLHRRRVQPTSSSGSATPPFRRGRGKADMASPRRKDVDAEEQRDKTEDGEDRASQGQLHGDNAHATSDDILICGTCRLFFDHVDDLISHKMAGCSLGTGTCDVCRCRSTGEPSSLACVYCGAVFNRAWALVCHCQLQHGVTVYTLTSGEEAGEGDGDPEAEEDEEETPTGAFETGEEKESAEVAGNAAPTEFHEGGEQVEEEEGLDGVELLPSPAVQEEQEEGGEEEAVGEDAPAEVNGDGVEKDKLDCEHEGSAVGGGAEEEAEVDGVAEEAVVVDGMT